MRLFFLALVAREFAGRKRNFVGQSFWARGYFVDSGPVRTRGRAGVSRAGGKSS